MSCPLNLEQVRNALKHKRRFTLLPPNATVDQINDAIEAVDSSFGLAEVNVDPKDKGDDLRRYTLIDNGVYDTDYFVSQRVTDASARKFRRRFTEAELEAFRTDPNNIIKLEYGNTAHNILEQYGKYHYDLATQGFSNISERDILEQAVRGEYPISKPHVGVLQRKAKAIVEEAFRIQNTIDPNKTPTIHFERVLIDPTQDIGGTVDVLVVFSDKTAMIFDYKTFSSKGYYVDGYGQDRKLISRAYAPHSKKESWKEQLNGYRRMLMTLYQIDNIRATRIVPIWLDIDSTFDTATDTYKLRKRLNKLEAGEEMNEFLRDISIGNESKGMPFIDRMLKGYYERIDKLREQYRVVEASEKEEINRRIEILENAIEQFVQKDQMELLLQRAVDVARELMDAHEDGESFDFATLNDGIVFLDTVVAFIRSFQEQRRELEQTRPELTKSIVDALEGVEAPLESLTKVLGLLKTERMDKLLASIPDRFGSVNREGDRIVMGDDSFLNQYFAPSSEQDNPIVKYTINQIQRSLSKVRAELRDFDARFFAVEEEVKSYLQGMGMTLEDLPALMLDENNNLINPIDSTFYEDRKAALEKNDIAFFLRVYKIKDKNLKGETYQEWYERRKRETEEFYQYHYEELRRENPDKFKRIVLERMDQWIARNNLSLDSTGEPLYPKAWRESSFLELNDYAKETYKSEAYKQIEVQEPLLNYYNFVKGFLNSYRPIIGYDVMRKNFFPKVRSGMVEKLAHLDFNGLGQELRNMFSLREDDQDIGMYDPIKGSVEKRIPLFFTSPLKDGDYTKDMGNALRLFAKVMFNYAHMEQVEAEVLAAKDILANNVEYYKTDSKGRKVFDKFHQIAIKTDAEGASLTEQVMETYVDYYLYGINMQVFANKPELTAGIMRLKNYFSLKTLGLGFIPGAGSYLAARSAAWIEGQKGQIYTKEQWHKAIREQVYNHSKYHGISYFFGVNNDEMLEQIVNTRGNKRAIFSDQRHVNKLQRYLNDRMLMRPFSYGDERLDNHIAVSMAMNYGVDADGNLRNLRNLPEGTPSIYDMFNIEEGVIDFKGNEEVVFQFRNAVRKAQRRIKGTMSPEDTNYAQRHLVLNLIMQFKTWMPGVLKERFGKFRYDEVLDRMEGGRYNILFQEMTRNDMEFTAGAAMYFVKTTANALGRFAKLLLTNNRLSRALGSEYKLEDNILRAELAELQINDPRMTLEDLRLLKEGQLRAVVAELEVLITFTLVLFALGADYDEDGDPLYKEIPGMWAVYKILNRVKTEISFTYNPSEYSKLVTSPIPLSSLAVNAMNVLNNTFDEAGDLFFGEKVERFPIPFGANRGSDRAEAFHYTSALIPGMYQLRRLIDMDFGPSDR